MKVFISWSGELSKAIAEHLKTWIPCIIQSLDVFFSPEDIEKGENWDSKITQVLSECNYGIICLTPQNVSAPWINFEAGAIAKSLDSRVSCLMANIRPSDIKGPLSRYQATKLEKKDFFQLISEINKATDHPLDESRLSNAFEAMWPQLNQNLTEALSIDTTSPPKDSKDDPLEEILQLLRKVSSIVSSPADLLPPDYFDYLRERQSESNQMHREIQRELIYNILDWIDNTCELIMHDPDFSRSPEILEKIRIQDIFQMTRYYGNKTDYIRLNRKYRQRQHDIERKITILMDSFFHRD